MTRHPLRALLSRLVLGLALAPVALANGSVVATAPAAATPSGPPSFQESALIEYAPLDPLSVSTGAEEPSEAPPGYRRDAPPITALKSLEAELDLLRKAKRNAAGQLVVMHEGQQRVLTVDPELQAALTDILKSYRTPYAAVVAIEPSTGRVLAMAEYSHARPELRGLSTSAVFPAASIFKIVTAAALLDEGVTPEDSECFHGGKRSLRPRHLQDSPRDRRCESLARALGNSANAVFAKMTAKHLTPGKLASWAEAFQFNRRLPFPVPVDISPAVVPEDTFEFATTGAGFGDVFLSPLHGASLVSVAANRGVWRDPVIFEDAVAPLAPGVKVMTPDQAADLADMMEETVTTGTARKVFRERGHRVAGAVGKTGSLADRNPFRDYSWFVGYAPKNDPQVAVAAIIVNDYVWHIRAPWLAREAMRLYLKRLADKEPEPVAAPTQGRRR